MINTFADIFSIGAVLSHTVAWVVGGLKEQKRYFAARKTHHDTHLRRFKNSGYEGCFHNSIEPLRVVAEQHKGYLERLLPSDDVTPQVVKWIEQCMLVQAPKDRLRARDIRERFAQFMESRPALQVVVSLHGGNTTAPSTSPSPRLQPSDSRSTIQPSPDDGSLSSSAHTRQANVLQGSTSRTPSCDSLNGLPTLTLASPRSTSSSQTTTKANSPTQRRPGSSTTLSTTSPCPALGLPIVSSRSGCPGW